MSMYGPRLSSLSFHGCEPQCGRAHLATAIVGAQTVKGLALIDWATHLLVSGHSLFSSLSLHLLGRRRIAV